MAFTIPNVYQKSYSGWDPGTKGGLLKELTNRFMGFEPDEVDHSSVDKVGEYFAPAYNAVQSAYDKGGKAIEGMYANRLQPELQVALNKMAGRGMTSSSVAEGAFGNVARNLSGDIAKQRTALESNKAGALGGLAGMQAQSQSGMLESLLSGRYGRQGTLAQLLGQVGQVRTDENPLQPYQMLLNFLQHQV